MKGFGIAGQIVPKHLSICEFQMRDFYFGSLTSLSLRWVCGFRYKNSVKEVQVSDNMNANLLCMDEIWKPKALTRVIIHQRDLTY